MQRGIDRWGTLATGMEVEFFGDTSPLEEIATAANTISRREATRSRSKK